MRKIVVIKYVRMGSEFGLRDSKELVDETVAGFDPETGEPRFEGDRAEEAKVAYEKGKAEHEAWLESFSK